jgi:hypothetical protein
MLITVYESDIDTSDSFTARVSCRELGNFDYDFPLNNYEYKKTLISDSYVITGNRSYDADVVIDFDNSINSENNVIYSINLDVTNISTSSSYGRFSQP